MKEEEKDEKVKEQEANEEEELEGKRKDITGNWSYEGDRGEWKSRRGYLAA